MSYPVYPEIDTGALQDGALTDLLQTTFAQLLTLPGQLVRPLWQPIPPNQPPVDIDWMALGIVSHEPIDYVFLEPKDAGETLGMQRQEYLHVICMFYGPQSDTLSVRLRDTLAVPNNWWGLNAYGLRYYNIGETTTVPHNINMQFIGRVDLPMTIVRQLDTKYPIPSFLGATGTIVTGNVPPITWTVVP